MMEKNKYKCIIVEDEALIRRNLSKKINQLNVGFTITGEVMDGESAIKLIEEDIPSLVITDIQMPIMNGIELIKYLYFAYPEIKIIIISGYDEFEYARQAIKYDVKEYLIKPFSDKDMISSLMKVKMTLDSDMTEITNLLDQHISSEEIIELIELYIKNNYKNNLTIADIASNLHFSSDYLSRVYKKSTGCSPLKYLINLRVNEAKKILLSNTEMSIKAVGEYVGYDDQYYFSRIFKKIAGLYPSEYRSQKAKI
jgi:two-component system, response regulator YesN